LDKSMFGRNCTFLSICLNLTWMHSFLGQLFFHGKEWATLMAGQDRCGRVGLKKKHQLQLQILQRIRQFGMLAILPGFAGHVPEKLKTVYPKADIVQLNPWAVGFEGTFFLSPTDPLFNLLGTQFIKLQTEIYGTDHLYNADPFNELHPPSSDPAFLANVSRSIYQSMAVADPDALWVLQAWFLVGGQSFWKPPQQKAFFGGVAKGNLLVLDLWAEVVPIWNQTSSFYGHDFIWCMLHNYGGRSGLYGTLDRVAQGPWKARLGGGSLVGLGLTPEATETNPIMYDLMFELVWTRDPVLDLDDWVHTFGVRRYGIDIPETTKAWGHLGESVYNCTTSQMGTVGSYVVARPGVDLRQIGCCSVLQTYYDPNLVANAFSSLISAADTEESLSHLQPYLNDLVEVGRHFLSDVAIGLYSDIMAAYKKSDYEKFQTATAEFITLINDMDRLLSTQADYMLGRWIQNARTWGSTQEEKNLYEYNARLQITLWGVPEPSSGLHEYAFKLWAGLVADFYQPRWLMFFNRLNNSIINGIPFDQSLFDRDVINDVEITWISDNRKVYPISPSGDTLAYSKLIYTRYASVLSRYPVSLFQTLSFST